MKGAHGLEKSLDEAKDGALSSPFRRLKPQTAHPQSAEIKVYMLRGIQITIGGLATFVEDKLEGATVMDRVFAGLTARGNASVVG